jgi:DNA-binding NarL/FixJ family response regulator
MIALCHGRFSSLTMTRSSGASLAARSWATGWSSSARRTASLPDGDGVTLARDLTALPWRPRIVLTSTDPDAATPEDVRSSGAIAFVPKDDLPTASLERLLAPG